MIFPICFAGALESELNRVANAARSAGSNKQQELFVVPRTPAFALITFQNDLLQYLPPPFQLHCNPVEIFFIQSFAST